MSQPQKMRPSHGGTFIIQTIGIMLMSLMISALALDFGYYFAAQNTLQTAADSGSLAAVTSLYHANGVDTSIKQATAREAAIDLVQSNNPELMLGHDDVLFGFIDPATREYDPDNFRRASSNPDYNLTGGYNAVYVRVSQSEGSVNRPLPTFLANMFGVKSMNASAESVALLDQTINGIKNGGLRPMYICEAMFRKAMADGDPENNVVRIYTDRIEVDGMQDDEGCPPMGSGNWSFADFRQDTPDIVDSNTLRNWFANGFSGTVSTGENYRIRPGNIISSVAYELDKLISHKTLFPVPLYDNWSGSGDNTKVSVSGFVGFRVTGYKANGSQENRYIEGRFYRYACKQGCQANAFNDNESSTPSGSIAKIRLAAR